MSVAFNVFLGQYQLAQSQAFPILFTLGVILIFNPLRDRIQALVDRIFFRKEYDYGEIIEKVERCHDHYAGFAADTQTSHQTFMEICLSTRVL